MIIRMSRLSSPLVTLHAARGTVSSATRHTVSGDNFRKRDTFGNLPPTTADCDLWARQASWHMTAVNAPILKW